MPNEKQQLTMLNYVDFTGGMNSAVPATSLADNEYQLIKNMEFNFNKLVTRGGLSAPLVSFSSEIKGVYFDEGSKSYIVVLANKDIYYVSNTFNATRVGVALGAAKPVFCDFDNKVFIATGGKLQYYDSVKKSVITINTSYNCDNVYERFGRLATTVEGDDNIYYSAVGDPYESKTTTTTIIDADGKVTTTTNVEEGNVVAENSSVTETTSTATKTTTISASIIAYNYNSVADVLAGTAKETGTTENKSQSHTIKVEEDYNNDNLISTVYYLDDEQTSEIDADGLTYESFVFGSKPVVTGYLAVTDAKDVMYGSLYRDVKDTSNNTTRTYYFDKQYTFDDNSVDITYKLIQVKSSAGKVQSKKLSTQYVKINFNALGETEVNDEYCIIDGTDKETDVAGGKKKVRNSTVAIFSSTTNGVTAQYYYKTRTTTTTTASTTSSVNGGKVIADNNGFKVGDVYEGVVNKTISSGKIENDDGTTTEYATVVNRYSKVTKITRTVVEVTQSNTNSSVNHTTVDTTITVTSVDNGSSVATTTKNDVVTDAHEYVSQGNLIAGTATVTTNVSSSASSNSTQINVEYTSGWNEDTNDDSSAKWTEIGYKDDGDILKALTISGDIAVFKTNGKVYSLSNEFPNWSVNQIAEHTDVINKEAIVVVGSDIAFMTKLGLKTLTTTATYGNFTTSEIARKINRSMVKNVYKPMLFNLIRKRQLIIVPDTSNDETRKHCYCYQYDIGAGIELEFNYPVYDMQDTDNGVIVACKNSLMRWSFDYSSDNGIGIEQKIVSKKYASSNRLFTRMMDIGVEGTTGGLVVMRWADKKVNYVIPEKRRMINVFSVCRDSEFSLETSAKISLEYIKLYIFEQ